VLGQSPRAGFEIADDGLADVVGFDYRSLMAIIAIYVRNVLGSIVVVIVSYSPLERGRLVSLSHTDNL
jgi:hypothetical protein